MCLIYAVMIACASLMFCRFAYSQTVTLKWPKQPASHPSPPASPQAASTNNQQSSALDRRPLAGSIVARTYTNNFFDFSVEFPENWVVIFVNQGPQENTKAVAYALLLVGSRDKRMHGVRWITIIASRPLGSILTAESARKLVENEANGDSLAPRYRSQRSRHHVRNAMVTASNCRPRISADVHQFRSCRP